MGKKSTTEEFIKKAKQKHNCFYKYDKSIYSLKGEKLIITCPIHGDFEQTPHVHLRGGGCKKCANTTLRDLYVYTTEQFIEKAINKHGNKYNYSKTAYGENSLKKVTITCKIHGDFYQIPNSHLAGAGCPKCGLSNMTIKNSSNLEKFLREANLKHNNKYDYSKSVYLKNNKKICIICPVHGEFWQCPGNHLNRSGCKKCGLLSSSNKQKNSIEKFFNKAFSIHGDKYLYPNLTYKNSKSKISVLCKKHNYLTEMSINAHLFHKQGCRLCSLEKLIKNNKLNSTGWSYENWGKKGITSKNFDSFKFYIIHCWDENEEFYKIGRTFQTLKKRFKHKKHMPYNWEVLYTYIGDYKEICELEQKFKNQFKNLIYKPQKKFHGYGECLNKELIKDYENYIYLQ